jgi:toxin ParE1/3/4
MKHFLLMRREAEADVEEAYRWYEARRESLGADFLLCVENTLSRIDENPLLFSLIHKDIRRAVVHRFPYGVFFRLVEKSIVVLAVFHARRDPRGWQNRS